MDHWLATSTLLRNSDHIFACGLAPNRVIVLSIDRLIAVAVEGFKSSALLVQIDEHLKTLSSDERKEQVKKVKGVFQFNVKNSDNKVGMLSSSQDQCSESVERVTPYSSLFQWLIYTISYLDLRLEVWRRLHKQGNRHWPQARCYH